MSLPCDGGHAIDFEREMHCVVCFVDGEHVSRVSLMPENVNLGC